jgi:hypothetical protein
MSLDGRYMRDSIPNVNDNLTVVIPPCLQKKSSQMDEAHEYKIATHVSELVCCTLDCFEVYQAISSAGVSVALFNRPVFWDRFNDGDRWKFQYSFPIKIIENRLVCIKRDINRLICLLLANTINSNTGWFGFFNK